MDNDRQARSNTLLMLSGPPMGITGPKQACFKFYEEGSVKSNKQKIVDESTQATGNQHESFYSRSRTGTVDVNVPDNPYNLYPLTSILFCVFYYTV